MNFSYSIRKSTIIVPRRPFTCKHPTEHKSSARFGFIGQRVGDRLLHRHRPPLSPCRCECCFAELSPEHGDRTLMRSTIKVRIHGANAIFKRLGRPIQPRCALSVRALLPLRGHQSCELPEYRGEAELGPHFVEQPQALREQRAGALLVSLLRCYASEVAERTGDAKEIPDGPE